MNLQQALLPDSDIFYFSSKCNFSLGNQHLLSIFNLEFKPQVAELESLTQIEIENNIR